MISIKINSGINAKRSSTELSKFGDYYNSNNYSRCDNKFLSSSFGTTEGSSNEQNGMLLLGDGALKVAMEQRKMVLNRRIRTNRMLIGKNFE